MKVLWLVDLMLDALLLLHALCKLRALWLLALLSDLAATPLEGVGSLLAPLLLPFVAATPIEGV